MKTVATFLIVALAILSGWLQINPPASRGANPAAALPHQQP
jgi:hypothetical protein